MIHLKSPAEVEKIRASCRIAADAMARVMEKIAPEVTTGQLDALADEYIRGCGAIPSAKGYRGYPKSICISVNEEVVHGIPGDRKLVEGEFKSPIDVAVQEVIEEKIWLSEPSA